VVIKTFHHFLKKKKVAFLAKNYHYEKNIFLEFDDGSE